MKGTARKVRRIYNDRVIAGFPTETEEHHAENVSIIRELDIVHGHIFPYSPRPGTPAAELDAGTPTAQPTPTIEPTPTPTRPPISGRP